MFNRISKRIASTLAALCCAVCLATPSFALIPNTGDGSGIAPADYGRASCGYPIILIIIYVVLSAKKKK